jgi:hypothetical protein
MEAWPLGYLDAYTSAYPQLAHGGAETLQRTSATRQDHAQMISDPVGLPRAIHTSAGRTLVPRGRPTSTQ